MTYKTQRHKLRPVWRGVILTVSTVFAIVTSGYCFNTNSASKTVSTDGSYTDTAAAVASVANKNEDGWTVTIGSPGGAYTWPTMLDITIPHVVTIQGASSTDRPVITVNATTGFGVFISATEGKAITLKDLRFDSWKTANGLILIYGGGDDCFRLTNLEFTRGNSFCVWVSAPAATSTKPGPYGLIDHCSIPSGGAFIFIRDNPSATPNSWHRPMSWGTKHAVYIEDCSFSAPDPRVGVWGVTDGDNGGRFVVRHCSLKNMPLGTHGPDSQPLENGQNPNRSILQVEVMHNTFMATGPVDTFFFLRGGTATVFDNTINRTGEGFLNTMIKTAFYRATPGNGVCPVDRFHPADYLGTQQPGCGVIDPNTYTGPKDPKKPAGAPWGSVPIYTWNNHINAPLNFGQVGGTPFVQPNRDYFVDKARPNYTEFVYPHPLQGSSTAGMAPNPPSNTQK